MIAFNFIKWLVDVKNILDFLTFLKNIIGLFKSNSKLNPNITFSYKAHILYWVFHVSPLFWEGCTGVLNSGLHTYNVDTHFSHISSPFCCGYFGDGSCELLAQAGLELRSFGS
jgi:hypothetical protein